MPRLEHAKECLCHKCDIKRANAFKKAQTKEGHKRDCICAVCLPFKPFDAANLFDGIFPKDVINHPEHYTSHKSGIECIDVTENFNFCLGNVLKYVWRADHKGQPIEDLEKALWYLKREIERRKKML